MVYVNLAADTTIHRLALGDLARPTTATTAGVLHLPLPAPLAPGATAPWRSTWNAPPGFKNRGTDGGRWTTGPSCTARTCRCWATSRHAELDDDGDRRKRGCARPRMADLNDRDRRQRNYVSQDADWISFAASACTAPDQVAVVPGT